MFKQGREKIGAQQIDDLEASLDQKSGSLEAGLLEVYIEHGMMKCYNNASCNGWCDLVILSECGEACWSQESTWMMDIEASFHVTPNRSFSSPPVNWST